MRIVIVKRAMLGFLAMIVLATSGALAAGSSIPEREKERIKVSGTSEEQKALKKFMKAETKRDAAVKAFKGSSVSGPAGAKTLEKMQNKQAKLEKATANLHREIASSAGVAKAKPVSAPEKPKIGAKLAGKINNSKLVKAVNFARGIQGKAPLRVGGPKVVPATRK